MSQGDASSLPIIAAIDWRLLIAIAALIVSLMSFFIQYFLPARIKVLLGDKMDFFYGSDGKLIIRLPLTLFNEGAKNTAVVKIEGRITEINSSRSMSFLWYSFSESKNVGVEGEEFRPHYAFAGWAHTMIVPARDAILKSVQFNTWDSFDMSQGKYKLEFIVRTGLNAKKTTSAQRTVEVTQEDSVFLSEKCKTNEKGVVSRALSKYSEESKQLSA